MNNIYFKSTKTKTKLGKFKKTKIVPNTECKDNADTKQQINKNKQIQKKRKQKNY